MSAKAIAVEKDGISAESYEADAAKLVSGSSAQSVWNAYSDKSEQFHCGIWEGAQGKWRVSYTEEEFCLLLDGEVELVNDAGETTTYYNGSGRAVAPLLKREGLRPQNLIVVYDDLDLPEGRIRLR